MANFFQMVFKTLDFTSYTQEEPQVMQDLNDTGFLEKVMEPKDKITCAQHRIKKTLFCEECVLSLCSKCQKKHDQSHELRTLEETADFMLTKFRQGQIEVQRLKNRLEEATMVDPTVLQCLTPCINDYTMGSANAFEYGNNLIDQQFRQMKKELNRAKREMKQKFLESYMKIFSQKVEQKSKQFHSYLEQVSSYIINTMADFEEMQQKGKLIRLCQEKPRVQDLQQQLSKCDISITQMCEKAIAAQPEFKSQLNIDEVKFDVRRMINKNMTFVYPDFEDGIFKFEQESSQNDTKLDLMNLNQWPVQSYPAQSRDQEGLPAKENMTEMSLLLQQKNDMLDLNFRNLHPKNEEEVDFDFHLFEKKKESDTGPSLRQQVLDNLMQEIKQDKVIKEISRIEEKEDQEYFQDHGQYEEIKDQEYAYYNDFPDQNYYQESYYHHDPAHQANYQELEDSFDLNYNNQYP